MRVPTVLLALTLAGCLADTGVVEPGTVADAGSALALPGAGLPLSGYHLALDFNRALRALEAAHPDLVTVEEIGQSVRGIPILMAVVTAPGGADKPVGFIDGCHHGNEVQGCEAPLYAAWFMAANYATNSTVRWMLDSFEFRFVPDVNPDGHDDNTRTNANGVNLNRNYPTDHGNPAGLSYPWDEPINNVIGERGLGVPLATESGGAEPLNQPETRAIADALAAVDGRLAFYLSFHTNTHSIIVPWAAFNTPREIPADQEAVFQDMLDWINGHLTYAGGRTRWGDTSGNLAYSASGSSMDHAYEAHEVYSTVMETYYGSAGFSQDASAGTPPGIEQTTDAAYWANSSMVYILKLAMNTDLLRDWQAPVREFPYPHAWIDSLYYPAGPPGGMRRDVRATL